MFDYVHDIQSTYRKVLECFSYPGRILSLKEELQDYEGEEGSFCGTQAFMRMLLDSDVSFHIVDNKEVGNKISQITYSKQKALGEADYVFLLANENHMLDKVIEAVKLGTLQNPHLGATIVVECEHIGNKEELVLNGPGIKSQNYVSFEMGDAWITARNEKNREYPLGVDMVFIDKENRLVALPRTTQVGMV